VVGQYHKTFPYQKVAPMFQTLFDRDKLAFSSALVALCTAQTFGVELDGVPTIGMFLF
jgi:hypothetical protein